MGLELTSQPDDEETVADAQIADENEDHSEPHKEEEEEENETETSNAKGKGTGESETTDPRKTRGCFCR